MKPSRTLYSVLLVLAVAILPASVFSEESPAPITIGSKAFTESVILGEMLRQLAVHTGAEAVHQRQLGGTRVLWNALLGGDIDALEGVIDVLLTLRLVRRHKSLVRGHAAEIQAVDQGALFEILQIVIGFRFHLDVKDVHGIEAKGRSLVDTIRDGQL